MNNDPMHTPEWVIGDSSTVYADNTAIYYLRRYGEPGIIASLKLTYKQAEELRASLRVHDEIILAKQRERIAQVIEAHEVGGTFKDFIAGYQAGYQEAQIDHARIARRMP